MSETASRTEASLVLKLERVCRSGPESVFEAWTDPARLGVWFGPRGFSVAEASLHVRPGGAYRIVMVSPEGNQHIVAGIYTAVERPRHLAFTWGWETTGTRGHETEVDITLDPHPEGCFLRLRHSNFESDTALAGHREGWSGSLDRLVECLAQPDA